MLVSDYPWVLCVLNVCIHGYELCVFACVSYQLWVYVPCGNGYARAQVCVCVCPCPLSFPDPSLSQLVFPGLQFHPCPWHIRAEALRDEGRTQAYLLVPEDLDRGSLCVHKSCNVTSSVGRTWGSWMLGPCQHLLPNQGLHRNLPVCLTGLLSLPGGFSSSQAGQRGDSSCPRSHS